MKKITYLVMLVLITALSSTAVYARTITNTQRGNITIGYGETLIITGAGRVNGNVTVQTGGTLTINATHNNSSRAISGRIFVEGGHVDMINGRVGGPRNNDTPAVVIRSGTFTMANGTIHSCSAHNHGGFSVDIIGGLFTMNGGTLIGGNGLQTRNAPTVRVNAGAEMVMNGGTIRGDEILSTTHGTRGVYVNGGTFTMNNGTIRSYINNNRPAVHVSAGGEFTLNGGSVQTGNKSNARAVRVDSGVFNMHGGELRNRSNNNSNGIGLLLGNGAMANIHGGNIHTNEAGIDVRNGATLNIYGGQVQNNRRGIDVNGATAVLNMQGGVVRNNRTDQGAGVRVLGGATFNLSGTGSIENNRASGGTRRNRGGGGVMISGRGTTFNMDGGFIVNNTADAHSLHTGEPRLNGFDGRGGGLLVTGNAVFNLTDGVIEGNTAPAGGAVAVLSYCQREFDTAFNMYGGYIRNNRSVNVGGAFTLYYTGGGVQVIAFNRTANANGRGTVATFNMHGGFIEDNVATSYAKKSGEWGVNGGGVSVVTQTGLFTLYPVDRWPLIPANAVFNFYGGNIRRNQAVETNPNRVRKNQTGVPLHSNRRYVGAGGVFVHKNGAVMNMFDGAVIEHNTARNGGGVTVSNSGTFNMYGGSIRYNIAIGGYLNTQGFELRGGGGVYLHNSDYWYPVKLAAYQPGQSWSRTPGMTPTFNMLGGEIRNNEAPSGGGVYWNIIPVDWITLPGIRTVNDRAPSNTRKKIVNNLFNRETNLVRVNIGPNAVIANNVAWSGTLYDYEVWARHQEGNRTIWRWQNVLADGTPNAGVSLAMRATGGFGANPFNNHDILTWGGFLGQGVIPEELEEFADITVTWSTVTNEIANNVPNIARVTISIEGEEDEIVYVENGEVIEDVLVGAEILVEPIIASIVFAQAGVGEEAFRVMSHYANDELTVLARLEDGELIEYPYESREITHVLTEYGLEVHFVVESQFWVNVLFGVYVPGFGFIIIGPAPVPPMGPFINGQNVPPAVIPLSEEYHIILLEVAPGVFMMQTPDGLVEVDVIHICCLPGGVLPVLPEDDEDDEYEYEDAYDDEPEYDYESELEYDYSYGDESEPEYGYDYDYGYESGENSDETGDSVEGDYAVSDEDSASSEEIAPEQEVSEGEIVEGNSASEESQSYVSEGEAYAA